MHVCHGPVKTILYKYAITIRKTVSLQGRREHRDGHPWRHFTNGALPHRPLLEGSP